MSNLPATSTFNYALLPPAQAAELRALAQDFEANRRLNSIALVTAGLNLIQAKKLCPIGQFQKWVSSELTPSINLVRKIMMVAEKFSAYDSDKIYRLPVSVLYVLAADRLPPEAVQMALDESAEEELSYARALEIADLYRPKKKRVNKTKLEREEVVEATQEAWLAFCELAGRVDMFYLSRVDDNDADDPIYVVVVRENGESRRVASRDVDQCVLSLAGRGKLKKCAKCERERPLDCFGVSKSSKDGRTRNCHACEVDRNRAYRKRKPNVEP